MLVIRIFFISGCWKDVPKCSDIETIKQLLGIIQQNNIYLKGYDISDVNNTISFEYIRPIGYNKDIKTYTCEARPVINGEFSPYIDEEFKFYIQYESVLDDQGRHLVFMHDTNSHVIKTLGDFASFILGEKYYFFPRKGLFTKTLNDENVFEYIIDPCFESADIVHAKFGDVVENNGFNILLRGGELDISSGKGAIVAFKSGKEIDTVLVEVIQKVNPYAERCRSKYILISGNSTDYVVSKEFGTCNHHIVLNDYLDTFSVTLSTSDDHKEIYALIDRKLYSNTLKE